MDNSQHLTSLEKRYSRVAAVVAPLALLVISYPAVAATLSDSRGWLLVAFTATLTPILLARIDQIIWPTTFVLVFVGLYALSAAFTYNRSRGLEHTVAVASTATVLLAFVMYGAAFLSFTWFRVLLFTLVTVDLLAIAVAELPKNATASAMVYASAVALVCILRRADTSPRTAWAVALAFFAFSGSLALIYNVRSLIVYSALFLIAFVCSMKLRSRTYMFIGIFASVATIGATLWFFLNINTSPLAASLSAKIMELSGHRANSGRDFLWPYILRAAKENPLFGLGAAALPRDFLTTQLSAHNYYLQVYLQVGILGLSVLLVFLLYLWGILSRANTAAGRFGSALFLMFVIHNGTEVLMFQNATLVSVPAWCAIGIAISIERNVTRSERNDVRRDLSRNDSGTMRQALNSKA
ncbi:O-antigen ligase family protein [Mycolicibacterium pulveris]|uniref:O-antigen ligase family protein n=1 Tax=Mycolicibacterium pulveris TaxID=36813 RepID=UPI0013D66307|nr:O-antigen ligase family protein [Mycolicibacterium pulveris]MCV6978717.1 O-antigen ligase family protein [Mycolicibacterium pulveris]